MGEQYDDDSTIQPSTMGKFTDRVLSQNLGDKYIEVNSKAKVPKASKL